MVRYGGLRRRKVGKETLRVQYQSTLGIGKERQRRPRILMAFRRDLRPEAESPHPRKEA